MTEFRKVHSLTSEQVFDLIEWKTCSEFSKWTLLPYLEF